MELIQLTVFGDHESIAIGFGENTSDRNNIMRSPTYDPVAVRPMWEELVRVGIRSLSDPEEVEEFITKKTGTTLMIVNSVCGCAAGSARPGAMLALQHKIIPDQLCTVFAGMDHDAVDKARAYMPVPPSSPCIALFRKGKMIYVLERKQIEKMNHREVANELTAAFDSHCSAGGPSCSPEEFRKIVPVEECGSNIPHYRE